MEPSDTSTTAGQQALLPTAPSASPRTRRAGSGARDAGPGVVRLNRALEPATRAATRWRTATAELARLDRSYERQRQRILARQRRASEELATFMTKTGASGPWLADLIALPETALTDTTEKEQHHGRR